jgi:hypothetical protein
MSETRPYLPAVRKALLDARTVGQLNSALTDLERFKSVWEFVAEQLKSAIASPSCPFDPNYGLSVLDDAQSVVKTIEKDASEVVLRPVGDVVPIPSSTVLISPVVEGGAVDGGGTPSEGSEGGDGEAAAPPPPQAPKGGKKKGLLS